MMTETTRSTRLFTLRLWQEHVSAEQTEWRGKVQALPEGDVHYFRDWPGLVRQLEAMLAAGDAGEPKPDA